MACARRPTSVKAIPTASPDTSRRVSKTTRLSDLSPKGRAGAITSLAPFICATISPATIACGLTLCIGSVTLGFQRGSISSNSRPRLSRKLHVTDSPRQSPPKATASPRSSRSAPRTCTAPACVTFRRCRHRAVQPSDTYWIQDNETGRGSEPGRQGATPPGRATMAGWGNYFVSSTASPTVSSSLVSGL